MKLLISNYLEAMKAPTQAAQELRDVFASLPLEQKLVAVIEEYNSNPESWKGFIFDTVLGSNNWYTGSGNVSLYDDFYWERNETKELSCILGSVLDDLEGLDGDETPEQLAGIVMQDEGPKAQTLKDFLNKNLGRAVYDW